MASLAELDCSMFNSFQIPFQIIVSCPTDILMLPACSCSCTLSSNIIKSHAYVTILALHAKCIYSHVWLVFAINEAKFSLSCASLVVVSSL